MSGPGEKGRSRVSGVRSGQGIETGVQAEDSPLPSAEEHFLSPARLNLAILPCKGE